MSLFLYIVILTVLLGLYYIIKRKFSDREYVQCVEAGPMTVVDAERLKKMSYYDRPVRLRDNNGHQLSHDRYARIVVNGDCMNERKIFNKDVLVAEKFSPSEPEAFKKSLKPDNIVWLYIKETGIDKIRVFERWEADEMVTYYFLNGEKKYSSKKHGMSQVKGIVRFKM